MEEICHPLDIQRAAVIDVGYAAVPRQQDTALLGEVNLGLLPT
jgi:hypothetical protein